MGHPVHIFRGLSEGDAILQAADHVVGPNAGVLVGKFIRCKTHWYPNLRLVEVSGLQRKFKTTRHHTDDRVGLAVQNDGSVEDVRISVWDSTSEARYMVLPARPAGTDGMTAAKLAELVTLNGLIGTALV